MPDSVIGLLSMSIEALQAYVSLAGLILAVVRLKENRAAYSDVFDRVL